jgi:hypothetical protein
MVKMITKMAELDRERCRLRGRKVHPLSLFKLRSRIASASNPLNLDQTAQITAQSHFYHSISILHQTNPPKPYTPPHHTTPYILLQTLQKTYTPIELPFLYNLSYLLCDSGAGCRSDSAVKINCLVLCFDGGFWDKFWFCGMGLRLEFDKEDWKPGLG